jgi:hypothetical protein
MNKLKHILILSVLVFACREDNGVRIFEMFYPNIFFEIPAGLNANFQQVFEIPLVASEIEDYLVANQTDTSLIRAILPFSARLTSLDGSAFDYEFVEAVSVRICDPSRPSCFDGEEVFYIDNLRGRGNQEIRLIPGLRNAKRDLARPFFRLEVVFAFAYPTPYAVRSRLQMSFEALR